MTTRTPHLYPVHQAALPSHGLSEGRYEVDFARSPEELDEVLRLRFQVFNLELGEGLESSFATGRDEDRFDAVCHHLVVRETETREVVGSYRLQTNEMAATGLGFYSDDEYDLSRLPPEVLDSSVELGRACVAREHRSTAVLFLLWKGLALYIASNQKRFLFGCSSLTSQDPRAGLAAHEYLTAAGYVHADFETPVRPGFECRNAEPPLPPLPPITNQDLPGLFRIYLRQGAKVCSPPALDRRFKTIDFLVMFDVAAMPRWMFRTFFG